MVIRNDRQRRAMFYRMNNPSPKKRRKKKAVPSPQRMRKMTYTELRRAGVKLHPLADTDKDKVRNYKDCRPLNKKKQDSFDFDWTQLEPQTEFDDLLLSKGEVEEIKDKEDDLQMMENKKEANKKMMDFKREMFEQKKQLANQEFKQRESLLRQRHEFDELKDLKDKKQREASIAWNIVKSI